MPRRPFTAGDLWKLPRVGAPSPSPDGKRVLVPVTTYDMEANTGSTRLWLAPADADRAGSGGKDDPARPLTTAEASTGQPAWSPEGDRIAFVRKPGGEPGGKGGPEHPGVPQLFVMPVNGGEPERMTDLPLGVADPRWFPDGRRVAFLATVYRDALTPEAAAKRKKDIAEGLSNPHVTEERFYRYWDGWLTEGKVQHIFVLDTVTGEMADLTPDSGLILALMDPSDTFAISPDGREIAFAALRGSPPEHPLTDAVFTLKVPVRVRPDGRPPRIVELTRHHEASAHGAAYSPDGRYLVYGMRREIDFYADKVRLVAYDREKRAHTVLTEDWDRSAIQWTFGREPRRLYLSAEADARTAFYRLDLGKAVRSPAKNPPREIARGGTMTPPRIAGGRIFASLSTLTEPPEVVSFDLAGGDRRALTAFTGPFMKEVATARVEEIVFEGAEGDDVQMFVLHPAAKPKGRRKRHPLVHLVHGGPHGVFGDQWHWRWCAQAFAAPGYVVAMVNFHGSTSWGQDFAASILGRWGDQPYRDVMAATDLLVRRGVVDPKRMAVTGGSYGGYLVSWIASQTDRFACIVNHAGVSDFQTQYASDVTQGRDRSMGGEPWDRQEGLDRYNPMRHAKGFKSPMLVVHGMKDYRVPYAQGLEIYNVYKAMGLPARLVVFPDENHWILTPANSTRWYEEFLGWLERWIGD